MAFDIFLANKISTHNTAICMNHHPLPHCWTTMRTRSKRTRGIEKNPDAFIRLNMRIVRGVAHFSFITQVERQLCIVNQGYAIVTEQE
jgi:hypothetical protein